MITFLIMYGVIGLIFGIFALLYSFGIFYNSKISFLGGIGFVILMACIWPMVLWSDFIKRWLRNSQFVLKWKYKLRGKW